MDFIKEFEELKLKQKLLIGSLNKKTRNETDRLLIEVNSKLDFLVKIFKEANSTENETEHLDEKFVEITEKLDSFNKVVLDKFKELDEKISDIKITSEIGSSVSTSVANVGGEKKETSSEVLIPAPVHLDSTKIDKLEDKTIGSSSNTNGILDILNKEKSVDKDSKKKWF